MEDNSINSQNKLTERELWFYNRLDELQRRMYLGEKAVALGSPDVGLLQNAMASISRLFVKGRRNS